MKDTVYKTSFIGLVAIVVVLATFLLTRQLTYAAATSGLAGTVATSSTVQAGPNINTATTTRIVLFAADTCTSRIVTTTGNPIMISFAAISSTTINGQTGHIQPASTTVAYGSGEYGCGLWSAYGYTATGTVTVTEMQ